MKRISGVVSILFLLNHFSFAQQHRDKKNIPHPSSVNASSIEKCPFASIVQWVRKDNDFEAKWGNGRLITFTPSGEFISGNLQKCLKIKN